ncbi:NACHT domain-containing protein [Streptomyces sp. NPDC000594]|uniref:NACHT domain-containing protein n=1 Tax=Streptomyces sp. NPDC000594 TaxID=3154261 RepID=UPI00332FFE76
MDESVAPWLVLIRGRYPTTGVLIDPRTVLTCADVMRDRESAQVTPPHDGPARHCLLMWSDPFRTGTALLRAEDDLVSPHELPPLRLGSWSTGPLLEGCRVHGHGHSHPGAAVPSPSGRRHHLLLAAPVHRSDLGPFFRGDILLGLALPEAPVTDDRLLRVVPIETVRDALHSATDVRLPSPLDMTGSHPEDIPYERSYATALKRHYGKLEVFGIDELGVSESTWDLDTAYLSLEATPLSGRTDRPADVPVRRPRRVEELLSGGRRTLLRGEAGAGKTTLVWWLAAHAACGTLPAQLGELNGLVPLVVPLRSVHAHGEGFPGPAALPEAASLAVPAAPAGWAERVLTAGRALLLVDGLDELPRAEREGARIWLTGLIDRYEGIRVLVTVRPGAVGTEWLADRDFADLLLLPMSDDDIEKFIAAWHRAARQEYRALDAARAGAEGRTLVDLQERLGRELANNRVLRDLARTPLLCAVICALHRKRRGALPHTRWELYRATLDMLLGNRDRGRGIDAPEGFTLGVEEHKLLLQHIAVWLVRSGRTQLTPEEATRRIELALDAMPQVLAQGDPRRVLTHLLNRSGLLQQRTGDAVQFIHRTFQDYLAAKEFAETGSVGELLQHAGDEQWRDVIRLSVGHFDRTHVADLVRQLIGRGDSDPERGRSLHLLAGYCAVSAVFLDGRLRAEAEGRVRALMPPRTADEVSELASFGESALPFLPGPTGGTATDIGIVQTIARIGGTAGVERLARFTGEAGWEIRRTLANAWSQLPTEAYAREVLAVLDLADVDLRVVTGEQLRQVHHCGSAPNLLVDGAYDAELLDACLPRTGIDHLSLMGNDRLTRLTPLVGRRSIKSLTVYRCPALETFEDIAGRGLWLLAMEAEHLSLPGRLPLPTVLHLLGPAEPPYTALTRWSGIRQLAVGTPARIEPLTEQMAGLPRLAHLHLTSGVIGSLGRAVPVPGISQLSLTGRACRLGTEGLARVFPALRMLRLSVEPRAVEGYTIDLRPLRSLPELRIQIHHPERTQVRIRGGEFFRDRLVLV